MPQSTRKRRPRKAASARPKKPYPDFPLSPHASGTWQKKIRGKIHYFGRWGRIVDGKMTHIEGDGWKEALEEYRVQAEALHAGLTPRPQSDSLTVADLCNRFLTDKKRRLDAGALTPRTYAEYKLTTDRLVSTFSRTRLVDDLAAEDFSRLRSDLALQYGPVRLGNEIQKVRTVFKYGVENGLIERAVRFGSEFKKPNKRILRQHKAKVGKKLFSSEEVRKLIAEAGPSLRAMILLGVNCGFGNHDCGTLPLAALDLESGWIEFPRPKTGIERRCPLWPETVAALRAGLADRPTPKGAAAEGAVFVTKYGNAWAEDGSATAVTHEFGKLLTRLGIRCQGVGFDTLRHTLRTVADATRDPNTIRLIMGHTDDSIDANYTHAIDNARLHAVADHVREWLFGPDGQPGQLVETNTL